ncbi:hypothetical protein F3K43_30850 [Streptomyces sp. LBUM 1476]|nr:hypothetical protein [Streptomyces sp. LBUM 1476]
MTADIDPDHLSSSCAVARQFGPPSGHADCRLTKDIPLPHGGGIVLIPRCPCRIHPDPATKGGRS